MSKTAKPKIDHHAEHHDAAEAPVIDGCFTLERALALPEVAFSPKAVVFKSGNPLHVRQFGSEDGQRLMEIVCVDGSLAAQQVET